MKWRYLNVLDIILFFLKDSLNFSVESANIETQDRSQQGAWRTESKDITAEMLFISFTLFFLVSEEVRGKRGDVNGTELVWEAYGTEIL